MLKISTVPNPILRQVSQPVKAVNKKLNSFIKDLEKTLINSADPPGVGLSAIQVGKPIRIFSTYLVKSKKIREIKTYINPKIVKTSKKLTLGPDEKSRSASGGKPILEGCLSVPRIWGSVLRHQWIKFEFETFDPKTNQLVKQTKKYSSFPARAIQHELDHLDGILFTDHSMKQNQPLYEEKNGELTQIKL